LKWAFPVPFNPKDQVLEKKALPAVLANLEPMLDFVVCHARAAGYEKELLGKIQLACEEALVNIINYAYPDKKGDMEIQCGEEDGTGKFMVRIRDNGIPFNPLERPNPNLEIPVEQREVGGLGIFLIRQIMDQVTYKRDSGRNILTLLKEPAPKNN
jgi:serine/threonine-protein kinase RsbW